MRIVELKNKIIRIPFKNSIGHSKKIFRTGESFIVQLGFEGHETGLGEGCPRDYVTGSGIEKTSAELNNVLKKIKNKDFENPKEFVSFIKNIGFENPICCALDIAFTDAWCNKESMRIYEYLGGKKRDEIYYDSGSPLATVERTMEYIDDSYERGVRNFKLKADNDLDLLIKKIFNIREKYPDSKIKIDANSCWDIEQTLKAFDKLSHFNIMLIEDPTVKESITELINYKNDLSIPIMADETLITLKDAQRMIEEGLYSWFNVRISKNGGLESSRQIIDLAKEHGIKVQIGSHYGETGILEAARRHLGCSDEYISTFEGANRTLLSYDITKEDLSLDKKLSGNLKFINGYGLGISLNERVLWN